jgi:group II intron reverse transcriptase/maturase/CRISPR-associated endonuclease Cas1
MSRADKDGKGMNTSIPEQLFDLCWHRIRVELVNTRLNPVRRAHPLSIVEAISKAVSDRADFRGISIFHILDRRFGAPLNRDDTLKVEFIFTKSSDNEVVRWRHQLVEYLSGEDPRRNFSIVSADDVEERTYQKLAAEFGECRTNGECCLEFLSPLLTKQRKDRQRTYLTSDDLVESLLQRFSRLFDRTFTGVSGQGNYEVLPYYWNYAEARHMSQSQPGQSQYINGCIGKLYIKGEYGALWLYLVLGSELHAGSKLSNAQGYYRLYPESQPYFTSHFPRQTSVVAVIRDICDRHDNAHELLELVEGMEYSEDEVAKRIVQDIVTGCYRPSPNTGFLVAKHDGTERLCEQLPIRDLVVQSYILKTINTEFERILEPDAIGFRKGVSRDQAIAMVRSAVDDGYEFVIESDIEDFFPSVDLNHLQQLLERYIPGKDALLRELLAMVIKNGYLLNGRYHERARGLAQGSPLSPLLANLYLDSFDEAVQGWNVRMIRYADDFIILVRTREQAEEVLSQTETFLSDIGLKLKKAKTAVRHVSEGFTFLGIEFRNNEAIICSDEDLHLNKKTLYVTEPFTFLSVEADTLTIKLRGEVIESIPMRRISEIIAMERAVLSTALLRKCANDGIPLTLTFGSGYHAATIRPDSKKFYDVAFLQAQKHAAMSETELLAIAKEFAAGKLRSFETLFRQRPPDTAHPFADELGRVRDNMYGAADLNELRGHEGAASKKIFAMMNTLVDEPAFRLKKRERRSKEPMNALLNFGFYLLFTRINAIVRSLGLNPYLGFLHSPENNYESLVADIEELFRARVCRIIIRLVNLKSITASDFEERENMLHISHEARKKFLAQFETELMRTNRNNPISLRDSIYDQAAIIKRFMLDQSTLSFYEWRP